jgi:hypothetical protein
MAYKYVINKAMVNREAAIEEMKHSFLPQDGFMLMENVQQPHLFLTQM